MEIRTITTFVRAAELQSFSKAAEEMGYSQSAVTVQIQQLEQELGVRLFERLGRNIRLTQEGDRFLRSSLGILKAIDDAKQNLKGPAAPTGVLRIGTADSMLMSTLPALILDFQAQCPQVELRFKTGTIPELFDMIRRNDVDILLFPDQRVNFPEWIKVFEKPTPIVFVASSEHFLAKEKNISLQQLLQEPLLLTERSNSYRYDLEQELARQSLEMSPRLETGVPALITKLLLKNAGISFLPKYVVDDYVQRNKLTILDVNFPKAETWIQCVYHKNKWVTPQMACFLQLAQRFFTEG